MEKEGDRIIGMSVAMRKHSYHVVLGSFNRFTPYISILLPSQTTLPCFNPTLAAISPWDTPSDRKSREGSRAASLADPLLRRSYPVIFATSGHKIICAPLPPGGKEQTLKPRYFTDAGGHKIHRHQLAVNAVALLPLWRMLLLGGNDDKIRICL